MTSLDTIQLTAAELREARDVIGQQMRGAQSNLWQSLITQRERNEIAQVTQLWNQGTAQSRRQAHQLATAAYDRMRDRYWKRVRRTPALRATFEDAGMQFSGTSGAPVYVLPDGTFERLTLEHTIRRSDDPTQAISANNLQFVLGDENSVVLEYIRQNDPFQ
jgi:hypothetical protein